MRSPLYYLTHWYTFRTVVGVLMAVLIAGSMYWLYTQPKIAPIHPEDRLFAVDNAPDPNVLLVGLDDTSIQAIGHYPFTRDKYATVLNNLQKSGAAVVAFDIQFSEDYTPAGDDLFAKAIGDASKAKPKPVAIILGYGQTDLRFTSGRALRMTNIADTNRPIDKLVCGDPKAAPGCQPVAQIGSTAILNDWDKIVRRVPMFIESPCVSKGAEGNCQPGILNPLAFVAYRQFIAGDAKIALDSGPDGARFGSAWTKPLWTDDQGSAVIDYQGAPGEQGQGWTQRHGQYLSFNDVFNNTFDRSRVDGKIVLVGVYNAAGVHDEQQTPTSSGGYMPGVEIQINVLGTLNSFNQKLFMQPEPDLWVLASLLLLCLVLGLLLPRLSALYGLGVTVLAIVGYTLVWIAAQGFLGIGMVPNFLEVWLALGLIYAGLMAYRFLYEEREKRKVKSIFGQYLKPELVEDMSRARTVDEIPLGGVRREVSLLFVDIRGFTHMSEGLEAEDVLKVLDEYLEDLTRIVFKWDGTLDKYVGDEIMAIWNAPHEQEQHALHAVRAAWEMVTTMPDLQKKLVDRGLPSIEYGIGVNTGPASVGIMGSRLRRAYTAIGDTVNTAARFCGAAGPTQILIGQRTYEECKDYIAVDMVPGLQLKGKSAEKFTVYRVTAIREKPGDPWVTVPGLQTYAEVGVYHQQTMIGAGATVSVETGGPTQEFVEPQPPQPVG